jgi:hypothetical protein
MSNDHSNNNYNMANLVEALSIDATTRPTKSDARRQSAKSLKEERVARLNWLIDESSWKSPDNSSQKIMQTFGFDPALFLVDMLHKICGKFGYILSKFTKAAC